MKVRWDPRRQRFPGIQGKLMIDTYRGQIRVRSWPKKRGTPKSQAVRNQNTWFTGANDLAKRIEPTQQNLAIAMTKGTGLYPRDLILKQMSGGLYDIVFEDGTNPQYARPFRETVVFQGAILELTANQNIPVGVVHPITFPLPVRDTALFWSAANPTRLTIPVGMNIVMLTCGWGSVDIEPTNDSRTFISKNGVTGIGQVKTRTGRVGTTSTLGPLTVVTGDFFELEILQNQVGPVAAAAGAYLTLQVLDAD